MASLVSRLRGVTVVCSNRFGTDASPSTVNLEFELSLSDKVNVRTNKNLDTGPWSVAIISHWWYNGGHYLGRINAMTCRLLFRKEHSGNITSPLYVIYKCRSRHNQPPVKYKINSSLTFPPFRPLIYLTKSNTYATKTENIYGGIQIAKPTRYWSKFFSATFNCIKYDWW